MADTTFTVTVATGTTFRAGSTGNVYFINGAQPTTDPSSTNYKLPWVAGATIRLDQSDSSNDGHPALFTNSDSLNTSIMRAGLITNNTYYSLDGASVSSTDYFNTSLFNAATSRFIEITQTAGDTVDFYFACWIHGIGMGGIIDLTQNTWGALYWGQGAWAAQGNKEIILPSLVATGSLNGAGIVIVQEPGWGTLEWGENSWGDVTGTVETLPSFPITASLGTLIAEAKQLVTLPGFGITGTLAPLTPFFDFELTLTNSFAITASRGTLGVNAGDDVQVGLTAFSMTGSVGALSPVDDFNIPLPSFELIGRIGNLIEDTTTVVAISTSLLATGSVGAITPKNATGVTLTGLLATGVLDASNVTTPDINIGLTGYQITASLNSTDIFASGYADVDIEGNTSYTPVKHVNQP